MSTHANRVKMTVASVAADPYTITLDAASSGFRSFATAYGANATVDVLITMGTTWEIARNCTYTHSGTTLSRGTLENSSTGSRITTFDNTAVVSVIAAAEFGNNAEMAIQAVTPGGRLTTESGVPVSTSDRTAQSTLYYTPYVHNIINLWDGSQWKPITFTEHTVTGGTLSGLTSGKPYDVFAYLSSGALATELLVWTNDTTRATAVTLQDGRYCKSGDKTRLLLGTIYTTGTTTTEDSLTKRYVSNAYNRTKRRCYENSAVTHTYTTAAWREWRGGTGVIRCNWVSTLALDSSLANMAINLYRSSGGVAGYVNLGLDATDGSANLSVANYECVLGAAGAYGGATVGSVAPVVGKHYLTPVQYGLSGVDFNSAALTLDIAC